MGHDGGMNSNRRSNSTSKNEKKSPVPMKVVGIEFSKATYSLQIADSGRKFWPVIELDEAGRLREGICECEEAICSHMRYAQAYVNEGGMALHRRFERHFWHQLFYRLSTAWDWTQEDFHFHAGELSMQMGVESVVIKSHSKSLSKALEAMMERPVYNERNCIKFSNVDARELQAWSRGRPGPWLRYETSLWSDLAKALFLNSCQVKSLAFQNKEETLCVEITSSDYTAYLELQLIEWELLLDCIGSVMPRAVQSSCWQDYLEKIEPDGDRYKLVYSDMAPAKELRQKRRLHQPPPQWQIKDWAYWPEDGLWKISGSDSWPQSLSARELTSLLETIDPSSGIWSSLKIQIESMELSHDIFFDEEGFLHIEPYVFEKGDIASGHVILFDGWAFDQSRGFQRMDPDDWDVMQVVKPSNVEAFIDLWSEKLRVKASFEVHLTGLELQLKFRVEPGEYLEFIDKLAWQSDCFVYGRWVFTKDHGLFWQKNTRRTVKPGLKILWNDVERFFDREKGQLEDFTLLWAKESPLGGQYLQATWQDQKLFLKPYETLRSPELYGHVYWTGHYSYVESEGFYYHAASRLLPCGFREQTVVTASQMDEFLEHTWASILPFIEKKPVELTPATGLRLKIQTLIPKKSPGDPLQIIAELTTRVGSVNLSDLVSFKSHIRWMTGPAGLIDRMSPFGQWLHGVQLGEVPHAIVMAPLHLLRLREMMEVESVDESIQALLGSWLQAPTMGPDTSLLEAVLRPYQEIGVRWMWQLLQHGLGALLCDDMGLGKTHQVMGVMAALTKQRPGVRFLVACPTSVLYHWHDKLKTFLPSLSIQIYHGAARVLDPHCNVVVTSYGILRVDERLSIPSWDLAVFDEVQLAKNARSRIWKSCGAIKATYKIGLSGTPIENSLSDLKALFDLIFPGYFGENALFKSQYVQAIEKYRDQEAIERLRHSIEPLVLRRCKHEVLLQLPDKIEEVGWCQLSDEQQGLYQHILRSSREEILAQLEDTSAPIPYMHIFAILNALKQVCDHPACYWRNHDVPAKLSEHSSGKWELFTTLLQEAISSQQKVVVFSQYLAMLDLIEEYLHSHHIRYSGLRGSTRARAQAVQRFQEESDCQVFVSSLNAGGLGIELTSASVVILYDRWWNAARENQAVDRVHRMGQTKGVQVFRFITKSTLEERIAEIISRKARLMDDVTPIDDPTLLKNFSREEFLEMLRFDPTAQESVDFSH